MTEDNSIWVIVEDEPEELETGGRGVDGAKNPWSSGKTVAEKATHSVRVSAATLQNRMSEFLQVVGGIFQRADRELPPQSAMQLDEVQLAIEITAEGEVKLVGTGGKVGSKGAITLKFKRKTS